MCPNGAIIWALVWTEVFLMCFIHINSSIGIPNWSAKNIQTYIRYIKMYSFIFFSGDVFGIFLSLNQSKMYNIDWINFTMNFF